MLGDDFGMFDDLFFDYLLQGILFIVEMFVLEMDDLGQDEIMDVSGDENSCIGLFDDQILFDWQLGSCDVIDGE